MALRSKEYRMALRTRSSGTVRALEDDCFYLGRTRTKEIKGLVKKAYRHRDAIARPVEPVASNVRVEAASNEIELTVRMGHGFRHIDNPMALVMLRCSNLPIKLPGRTQPMEVV